MGARASRPSADVRKEQMNEMYERYAEEFRASKGERWPEVQVEKVLRPDETLPFPERLIDPRTLFVDCRTSFEVGVSRIPGAVTEREFTEQLKKDEYRVDELEGIPVVLYCTIGYRSGRLAANLAGDYPSLQVANLAGSLLSWSHHGG